MTLPKIILGSTSPRRKEILSYFKLPFEQASPNFDEESVPQISDPEKYAILIARGKLDSLLPNDALVISADTVVFKDGKYFAKPKDMQEALSFLKELQGKEHAVISGICVHYQGKTLEGYEKTNVLFNSLDDEKILDYLNRIEWKDKAGGYGIQESGALLINKIEGCFYNVMGFPINTLKDFLHQFGINLWKFL